MTAEWVPAHRRLMKGPKKSIPRAIRFVLLELSLEARPTNGVLDLPVKWETLRAVHDLLGGNRREIRLALEIFSKPDETGQKVIEIVRDRVVHKLVITKWPQWAGPKSSTDRVREHRRNKALANDVTFHGETDETPTGEERTKQESVAPARARTSQIPDHADEGADADKIDRGLELASCVWGELWRKKYGRDYELGPDNGKNSDLRVLSRIGGRALKRQDPDAYLRHKVGAYLRDHGDRNYLDEREHPLRTIERDWTSYGEPKPPKAPAPHSETNGKPVLRKVAVEAGAKKVLQAMRPRGNGVQ